MYVYRKDLLTIVSTKNNQVREIVKFIILITSLSHVRDLSRPGLQSISRTSETNIGTISQNVKFGLIFSEN